MQPPAKNHALPNVLMLPWHHQNNCNPPFAGISATGNPITKYSVRFSAADLISSAFPYTGEKAEGMALQTELA